MPLSFATLALFLGASRVLAQSLPVDKVMGVNLGNWLVDEPWMSPSEWSQMGGDNACTTYELTQQLGDKADAVFLQHYNSWFNETDVQKIQGAGLNTVRIPLGFWLVEDLVNSDEFFPKGGLPVLKRIMASLQSANIHAILDHHALPGVAAVSQQFAGRCTKDVQFYTAPNYQRALTWAAVMTAITHLDADFGSAFALEAANEPIQDASKTPGYGDYQTTFVETVRAMEQALGITVPSSGQKRAARKGRRSTKRGAAKKRCAAPPSNSTSAAPSSTDTSGGAGPTTTPSGPSFEDAVTAAAAATTGQVQTALMASIPILQKLSQSLGFSLVSTGAPNTAALFTSFMTQGWQYNNPPNPADAAKGPQAYDDHLYFCYGGVADANADAYLKKMCNLDTVATNQASNNSPFWFGEWSLCTNFQADDAFMTKWADAQKLMYSQSNGWIFWSYKKEGGDNAWDYMTGLEKGYFTQDPTQLNDPNVCAPYR